MNFPDGCPLAPLEKCVTGTFTVHCKGCQTLQALLTHTLGEPDLLSYAQRAVESDRRQTAQDVAETVEGRDGCQGRLAEFFTAEVSDMLDKLRGTANINPPDDCMTFNFRLRRGHNNQVAVEGLAKYAKERMRLLVIALAILEHLNKNHNALLKSMVRSLADRLASDLHQVIAQ